MPLACPFLAMRGLVLRFYWGITNFLRPHSYLGGSRSFLQRDSSGYTPPTFHYTASTVAHLFMDIVGKIHGMSRSLVSNQDSLFISHFWQELFKLSGTKLHMSSAYHPQSGRQTKVINRVIEQHLRAFVHHQPLSWGTFVIWVEWSYNTSVHSRIGLSPYKITFGKKPPNIP